MATHDSTATGCGPTKPKLKLAGRHVLQVEIEQFKLEIIVEVGAATPVVYPIPCTHMSRGSLGLPAPSSTNPSGAGGLSGRRIFPNGTDLELGDQIVDRLELARLGNRLGRELQPEAEDGTRRLPWLLLVLSTLYGVLLGRGLRRYLAQESIELINLVVLLLGYGRRQRWWRWWRRLVHRNARGWLLDRRLL